MKNIRLIKHILFTLLVASIFWSCAEDVNLVKGDESKYQTEGIVGYLKNVSNPHDVTQIDLFENNLSSKTNLYLGINKAATQATDFSIEVAPGLVDEYNLKYQTNLGLFPVDKVTLASNGSASISIGQTASVPVEISINADASMLGKTYILPIKVKTVAGNVAMQPNADRYFYIVQVHHAADASKGPGSIKTILYVETNITNPLNAKEYTMKNSGKPFVDMVNLFAANIHFSVERGPYLFINSGIQAILDNRDHYIKPLQDLGIKVNLSVLGGGNLGGIQSLGPEAAKAFAAELKAIVDRYGLDGVDFDDEYTNYNGSDQIPGLRAKHADNYSRLCYEVKRAMPDKLCNIYHYNIASDFINIDGVEVNKYVDYGYEAIYFYWNPEGRNHFPGVDMTHYCPYSIKLTTLHGNPSSNPVATEGPNAILDDTKPRNGNRLTTFKRIKSEGWGVCLLYNMISAGHPAVINQMSEILYGEGVNWSGVQHPRDFE